MLYASDQQTRDRLFALLTQAGNTVIRKTEIQSIRRESENRDRSASYSVCIIVFDQDKPSLTSGIDALAALNPKVRHNDHILAVSNIAWSDLTERYGADSFFQLSPTNDEAFLKAVSEAVNAV